ncbi:MAG: hypothetical protein HKP41_19600 [Desulfobacterales bacterium]|nr:hypothetical protein [Desulfobacterales bacterium]
MGLFDFLNPRLNVIKGKIGYYGLEEWWKTAFTAEDRKFMVEECRSYMTKKDYLTTDELKESFQYYNHYNTNLNAIQFLLGFSEQVNFLRQDRLLSLIIIEKALEMATKQNDIFYQHIAYTLMISFCYYHRKNPLYFDKAMWACKQQIKMSHQAIREAGKKQANYCLYPTGFKQLAIVLEKHWKFQECIDLCIQADEQGWEGDWKKRIARCKKRQENWNKKR